MSAPSARGLFRATGKKPKPVVVQMLDGTYAKSADGLTRAEDDFYPTPPEPTQAFLAAEINRLRQFGGVWEPAAGDGAMVREMMGLDLMVYASDLIDRGCGAEIQDFFAYRSAPLPAIVTNPPYDLCGWGTPGLHAQGKGKARWLFHALDVLQVEYMALLLNWNWPCAGGMEALWSRHPPARVYPMRWKIDFTQQGAPPNQHAWFVWDRRHQGETVLRMLDRKDARQHELFDDMEASNA